MRALGSTRNFLGIDAAHSSYATSRIAVLSAPYEHTVSYGGGTAGGPRGILEASHYVEFWDEEFARELCFDVGIATLAPVAFGEARDGRALRKLEQAVRRLLDDGKFVVTLGGEHTISAAPIRAHAENYPGMSVLQFDAHSDLRESYQGNRYSHASVMARVAEFFPAARIVQVGIRAQCIEEFRFIEANRVRTFFASAIRAGKYGTPWQTAVFDALADEVYITFDVDYFDPSIMATTGTPEPGGFGWDETMSLLKMIGERKRIVGFDVVELSPSKAMPAPTYLAAKLVYKLMNAAFMRG